MRSKQIVYTSLAVRISQALLTSTFFQPDEFFQALEPAHHLVFGYGHLTWEWRHIHPIRSIIYPAVFAPAYWLVKVLGLEHGRWLIWAPKITQGMLASITDVAVCKIAVQLFGRPGATIALLLSLTSFFHGLALVRTFSNSLETSLTTLALSYWLPITHPVHPKESEKSSGLKAPSARKFILPLSIAALACAIRPTGAVLWIYLVGVHLFGLRKQPTRVAQTLCVAGVVGAISTLAILSIDTWYYRDLTFTPFNFLRTNLSSISLFYGGMPWHYYFTQACPILLTTCLPFFLHGVILNIRSQTTRSESSSAELTDLMWLTIWTTMVYSLAGHKEWRFLHPLLPIMHLFCTKSLLHLTTQQTTNPTRIPPRYLGLILLQIPAMIYVAFFHGRAQIAVMHYLRSIPPANLTSVGFLMPCHSTPWQAYLHRADLEEKGRMWGLGCEPPLGVPDLSVYVDQTTTFYRDPMTYLAESFPRQVNSSFPPSPIPTSPPGLPLWAGAWQTPPNLKGEDRYPWQHEWPEHLVVFGALLHDFDGHVEGRLRYLGYQRVWRTFNGFEEDEKRRGGVEVWRWDSS